MSSSKITNIPHFIKARSPEGLRKLMLNTNVKWGYIFDYFKIYRDSVDNMLYAWFQLDAVEALQDELKEIEARGKSNA